MAGALDRGREDFRRRKWSDAYAILAEVESLSAEDLERLAVAAYLVGRDEESARAWEHAHTEHARAGEIDRAVRCAFWLGLGLMLRGDMARAGGWLARAERLIGESGVDCAARGLLLVPASVEALETGDAVRAQAVTDEMMELAHRFDDADLMAFAVLCAGELAVAVGEVVRGMRLLDEAMVSVTAAEVSPIVVGIVYCAVIEACMRASDLRRAGEWTEALHEWCSAQPDLVPYRGQCLVHRSQLLLARGAWPEAASAAEQARRRLSAPRHPALGLAHYQQGELHRLRGEFGAAERSYRAASEHGFEPAPGLALLRLAEGRLDAAVASVHRMAEETRGRLDRHAILGAAVAVLLEAGDVDGARQAAAELAEAAAVIGTPLVQAVADFATGSVARAEGDPSGALTALRQACSTFRDLEMPYEVARARVEVALACRALGDDDGAELELHAADTAFERLGARPDRDRLARLAGRRPQSGSAGPGDLTGRELEVLQLVAAGLRNREIARELVISEHTVARHLQNIFLKVAVSSRAAAVAYAYDHGLVRG